MDGFACGSQYSWCLLSTALFLLVFPVLVLCIVERFTLFTAKVTNLVWSSSAWHLVLLQIQSSSPAHSPLCPRHTRFFQKNDLRRRRRGSAPTRARHQHRNVLRQLLVWLYGSFFFSHVNCTSGLKKPHASTSSKDSTRRRLASRATQTIKHREIDCGGEPLQN